MVAELTWEKTGQVNSGRARTGNERIKFLVGGALIMAAVAYLILSGTAQGAQYFITVEDLISNPDYAGQTVRISGAVIGETIDYDSKNLIIDFTIAHIPQQTENLALTLSQAVQDSQVARLAVHIENEVMPDLLQNEAQAILTGELGPDNIFYATELLLKCPSRYEEDTPQQVAQEES